MTAWWTDRSRLGWSTVLAGATLALAVLAFSFPRVAAHLGYDSFPPRFADLVAILAAGQAHQAGLDVYAVNPFDPHGRPHVYGPQWLVVGALGWTVQDAAWLGLLLAVVFVGVGAAVLAPRDWRPVVGGVFFLCSPPVLLGIDRANNDLVVFLLLTAAAAGCARPGAGGAIMSGVSVGLAALLKLYPVAAWPMLVLREGRGRRGTWLLLAGLAACLAVFWFQRADYLRVLQLAPRPRSPALGAFAFPELIMDLPQYRWELLAGWLAGAGIAAGLAFRPRMLWNAIPTRGFSALCFVAGGLAWIFCYAVNVNYSYRLVLLLLPARIWLASFSQCDGMSGGRRIFLLWLAAMWMAVPRLAFVRAVRETGHLEPGSWLGLKLTIGAEQGLVWMLTLMLAISCVGVLVRRTSETSEPPPA